MIWKQAAKGEPKNETFPQFLEVQLDLLDSLFKKKKLGNPYDFSGETTLKRHISKMECWI